MKIGLNFNRANFNLTRAISTITRVAPDRRVETLMKFRRRLAETPQVLMSFDHSNISNYLQMNVKKLDPTRA
jgi:hypothetical protein